MLTHNMRTATVVFGFIMVVAFIAALAGRANAYDVTADGVRNRLSNALHNDWECSNLEVKVEPYEDPQFTAQGRFKSVVISADAMTRKGKGITIRSAYIKGFDVVFDIAKLYGSSPDDPDIYVKSRKTTSVKVKLMENDTNKLLAMKKGPVENLRANFGDGQITFSGVYRLVFGNKFRMTGKLQMKDKHLLNFIPTSASVNGVPIPAGVVRKILSKMNPIVDTYMIPMRPKIDKVQIEDAYILVTGDNA